MLREQFQGCLILEDSNLTLNLNEYTINFAAEDYFRQVDDGSHFWGFSVFCGPSPIKLRFMSLRVFLIFLLSLTGFVSNAQLLSPDEFLPQPWGEHFNPHHRLVEYFKHVAGESPRVQLQEYGKTNEGRPLIMAFISTPGNLEQLEQVKKNNRIRAGLEEGTPVPDAEKVIVWISYSVHGNEAAGSESAYMALYRLADPANDRTGGWLENTIVVLDPCVNPDGYSRYTEWYRRVAPRVPDPRPDAREHREPWPGGRSNHYYFDLNRDWAWQTQWESVQRMQVINDWLPHIHADVHEQGINSPYYFAPAAQPFHRYITQWQRSFQTEIGKNHARYFDANGWLYFTKEVFDLLYPSYGDTYPTYNGAIGMTYEQGGSGRAGRAVLMDNGDTLTLKDRVDHHLATSLSTVEMGSVHARRILDNFQQFWKDSKNNPPGKYKTFIISGNNAPERIKAFCELLDRNGIRYGAVAGNTSVSAFDYQSRKNETVTVRPADLVVSAHQPKGLLAQILLEPGPELVDTNTYDITAWSLPYAYGLETYAAAKRINVEEEYDFAEQPPVPSGEYYAYLIPWQSMESVRFLARLLKSGLKVRVAQQDFVVEGRSHSAGTLVVNKGDNRKMVNFDRLMQQMAGEAPISLTGVKTGFVDQGKDFGSRAYQLIETPKVAILGGEGVRSYSFGQLWYYLEQKLEYPFQAYETADLGDLDYEVFNTLVLTDGRYEAGPEELRNLRSWIREGGHLVLIGSATRLVADKDGFRLKSFATPEEEKEEQKKARAQARNEQLLDYAGARRRRLSSSIPGAIIKNKIDLTHPLGFGIGNTYFSLRTNSLHYPYLTEAWNVGVIGEQLEYEGFIGSKIGEELKNTTTFASERSGGGHITYLVDNPLFRAFWYNGMILMGNALFFAGN